MANIASGNFYDILGVSQSATVEDIKKAYRIQSLRTHPDKNPNDPEATKKFQLLQNIYETLTCEFKRKLYDQFQSYQNQCMQSKHQRAPRESEEDRPHQHLPTREETFAKGGKWAQLRDLIDKLTERQTELQQHISDYESLIRVCWDDFGLIPAMRSDDLRWKFAEIESMMSGLRKFREEWTLLEAELEVEYIKKNWLEWAPIWLKTPDALVIKKQEKRRLDTAKAELERLEVEMGRGAAQILP